MITKTLHIKRRRTGKRAVAREKGIVILGIMVLMVSCALLKKEVPQVPTKENKRYTFPMDWIGHYEGELIILNHTRDTTRVNMQLLVEPPDAVGIYPWILIYGEDDIRAYGIEAVNAEKGHYLIDEYNSIKIDSYLMGNHFISRFAVMGSDLLVDYERVAEGVSVRLYVSRSEPVSTTGGEIIAQDTVPMVDSYPQLVTQKAFLKKK